MLQFVQGDMFAIGANVLVNTVNTVGVSGKGVALEFKHQFPENYLAYRNHCVEGCFEPGDIFWRMDKDVVIANVATKDHWRDPSRLEWIEKIVTQLAKVRETVRGKLGFHEELVMALPPLGCGCGGLNWLKVRKLIEQHLSDANAEIFAFEPISQGVAI